MKRTYTSAELALRFRVRMARLCAAVVLGAALGLLAAVRAG